MIYRANITLTTEQRLEVDVFKIATSSSKARIASSNSFILAFCSIAKNPTANTPARSNSPNATTELT